MIGCTSIYTVLTAAMTQHLQLAPALTRSTLRTHSIAYVQGFAVSVTTDPEQIEYLESCATVMLPQG
jgi:hypothetical protein